MSNRSCYTREHIFRYQCQMYYELVITVFVYFEQDQGELCHGVRFDLSQIRGVVRVVDNLLH